MKKTISLKKIIATTLIGIATLSLSGCFVKLTGTSPNLAVKFDAEKAERVGHASCQQFLWAFATGDCSVTAAMKDGGLSKLHHVDDNIKIIVYGLYSELTTTVYGE